MWRLSKVFGQLCQMWLTDVYSKESVRKHNKHIYKTVLSSCTYVVEKRLRRSFRDATYYSHPHTVDSVWNWILKLNHLESLEMFKTSAQQLEYFQ